MVKGRIIFFVALLLILSISTVSSQEDLNLASDLDVRSVITIPIDMYQTESRMSIDYFNLNYSWLPKEDYRQEVTKLATNPQAEIFQDHAIFSVNKIHDFDIKITFDTKTISDVKKVKKKVVFPIKSLNSELIEYTKETELVDITPEIKLLASNLAGDEDDLYVVVFKLADWVNSNIDYNLSTFTAEANLPSSWVLENRKGVCDEMSNLFVSMVRSLGIPAKIVSGIAYTDSELFDNPWGAHGWTEVYFPGTGWVAFDPTYNQLGYVDATHIKLEEGLEGRKFNMNYEWRGSGFDVEAGEQDIFVNVLRKGHQVVKDIEIDIQFMNEEVSYGSYNVVEITVTNKREFYLARSIGISNTEGLNIIGELRQDILLKPFEQKKMYFLVEVSNDLQKDYIYTFPVSVFSQSGEEDFKEFKAKISGKHISKTTAESYIGNNFVDDFVSTMDLVCKTEKSAYYLNEELGINCELDFETNNNVKVCIESTNCSIITPNQFSDFTLYTSFDIPGFRTFVVDASANGERSQSFITTNILDDVVIKIKNVSLEKTTKYAEREELNFIASKESFSVPKNLKVFVEHDYFKQQWDVASLSGSQGFSFKFPSSNLKADENEIKIRIEYEDDLGKKFETSETVKISLVDLEFWDSILVFLNSISMWIENL